MYMSLPLILAAYLLTITILTAILYRRDHLAAMQSTWAVSEGKLLALVFAGGTLGGLRELLRGHKKYNPRFKMRFYNIMLVQILLLGGLAYAEYGDRLTPMVASLQERFASDPSKPKVLRLGNITQASGLNDQVKGVLSAAK